MSKIPDTASPSTSEYAEGGVRYSIASARARLERGSVNSMQFDSSDWGYGGADPELAADIQSSIGRLWQ